MKYQDLRLFELNSLSEMEKVREVWNRVVLNMQTATPFQSWEWNFGMAKFKMRHVRLRIVVAENKNGKIIGIAPFWILSRGLPGMTILEFIGNHQSDYSDLIFLEKYKDIFVSAIKAWINRNTEWRIIHLQKFRWNLGDMSYRNVSSEIRPSYACLYISLPKTIEEYDRKLQRKIRQAVHRQNRLLGGDGRLRYSISQTTSQLKADLPILFDLHQQRLRSKGERGRFFNKHWIENFKEMSLMMHQAGFLRFGTIRIDGHPAACYYNLRIHDREYAYMTGMAPDYARYSPGSLLQHWMIGEAIKDGMHVYDFGVGDEQYKFKWTKETRQLSDIILTRTKADGYIWGQWESWRNAAYNSPLIKQLYLATIGKFQT